MSGRVLTHGPGGKILTNAGVWSPDGEWIVFDTRSDAAGSEFDGTRIEAVHADTGEVRTLYESANGACCGIASWHPARPEVVFVRGPEFPTAEWNYAPSRRSGLVVSLDRPGVATHLEACDLTGATLGALSGGSHVHQFRGDGRWVSFTYDDQRAVQRGEARPRNVAVAAAGFPVGVPPAHPRHHAGTAFARLVTDARHSDEPGRLLRACEESWLNRPGRAALAFQGEVLTPAGERIAEVFVAEWPDDPAAWADPKQTPAITVRRVTDTAAMPFPGLSPPRHWLRPSADGSRIACLIRDADGVPQLWTVTPDGGELRQVTRGPGVESAFTWHPAEPKLACVIGGRVCVVDTLTGGVRALTAAGGEVRPEACVFSPDGSRVAFVRRLGGVNQVCVAGASF